MRKKTLLLLVGLAFTILSRAQQLSPSIIASDGGVNRAAGLTLEWTLGEPMIETITGLDKLFTQGFHQPLLLAKNISTPTDELVKGYKITIAPNPVQSVLTAIINAPVNDKLTLTLMDINGRRSLSQVATGKFAIAQLDMSGMISGVYLLEIRNAAGLLIQSFKIIKAN